MNSREQYFKNYIQSTISGKTCVKSSFLLWVEKCNPDYISRAILSSLLDKFDKGDKLL